MSAKAQITQDLIHAKRAKGISFEELGKIIGRDEVAVAGIFYGQTFATEEELDKLAGALGLPSDYIVKEFSGFPNRGEGVEMPPREPLIYRLYEIVQNYGQAYKAVMNEKFGDGIMSAIAFSTKVDKEIDDQGVAWANIYMRGKWLPYSKF